MELRPELEPDVAAQAPDDGSLTDYDHRHLITYLRLLDADADEVSWEDAARCILRLDPHRHPKASRDTYRSHLQRARWMTEVGYVQLLGAANDHS
ncbi:MAG: DUF2285 domain-containing protein [Pseudomonadota bacterium]